MSRKGLVLGAGLVAAGAIALSGCQTQSPIQSQFPYQPADGVAVSLGDVQVRDLVVVAGAKDQPGALSGAVVNNGNADVTISFATADGGQAEAKVPAHDSLRLTDGATITSLPKVSASPGGLVEVEVSTPAGGAQTVKVPVLLPQGYYSSVTPSATPTSGATSEPGATSSPSTEPSASETATPTATAS